MIGWMIIMANKIKFILFFSALAGILFFITACEESVILDPKEKVVNVKCILSNDTVQTVKLTYSSYLSESYYPPVKEAEVSVSFALDTTIVLPSGNTLVIDTTGVIKFEKINDGKWQAKFTPIPWVKYTLSATIQGKGSISATTLFPDTATVYRFPYAEFSTHLIEQNFLFLAPKRSHSYIMWCYGMDYDTTSKQHHLTNLIFTDFAGLDKFNILSTLKINVPEFQTPDLLNPFPPITFDNWGYYIPPQYLAAKDGKYDSELFPMYDRYLRMVCDPTQPHRSRKLEETFYEFNVVANFKPQYYDAAHPESYLRFFVVSKEYDLYLKDLLKFDMGQFFDRESSDIAHLWEYKEVYTNIKNGRGIFGAEYKSVLSYAPYKNPSNVRL